MSGGGVATGVVQELTNGPADAGTIRDRVEGVRYLRRDRDGRVRPGYLVDGVADEGTEIHVTDLEREGAPFQFGDRDDLVDDLHQAVKRRLQLLDELLPLRRRDVRVPQDVGDPLRNRHGGPQLVRDVRQEVGFGRRALGHVRPQLVELRLQLHRANDGASDFGPERRCDHRGEDDTASERGTDRSEHDLGTLLAQDVPGGAGGEGLGDAARVARRRATADARGGGGGAQAPHQLSAGRAFEAQVDHDHV